MQLRRINSHNRGHAKCCCNPKKRNYPCCPKRGSRRNARTQEGKCPLPDRDCGPQTLPARDGGPNSAPGQERGQNGTVRAQRAGSGKVQIQCKGPGYPTAPSWPLCKRLWASGWSLWPVDLQMGRREGSPSSEASTRYCEPQNVEQKRSGRAP